MTLRSASIIAFIHIVKIRRQLTAVAYCDRTFKPGDIMMGDKGFCSYYDVWKLQEMGVDTVSTLARRT